MPVILHSYFSNYCSEFILFCIYMLCQFSGIYNSLTIASALIYAYLYICVHTTLNFAYCPKLCAFILLLAMPVILYQLSCIFNTYNVLAIALHLSYAYIVIYTALSFAYFNYTAEGYAYFPTITLL